ASRPYLQPFATRRSSDLEILNERPKIFDAAGFRDLIKQGLINENQDFGADTDLFDELINKSNLSQYHNFAASGGTENTNYRASRSEEHTSELQSRENLVC